MRFCQIDAIYDTKQWELGVITYFIHAELAWTNKYRYI